MGNMKIKVSNNNNNKNVLKRIGSAVEILLYMGRSTTNLYLFYFLISYSLVARDYLMGIRRVKLQEKGWSLRRRGYLTYIG